MAAALVLWFGVWGCAAALTTDKAGQNIDLNALRVASGGDARNSELMAGSVSGTQVKLDAGQDLTLRGTQVNAQTSAVLQAGGDVRIASELQTQIHSTSVNGVSRYSERTTIGAVGGVNVASGTGVLSINAGRDVTLTAADLSVGVRTTTPATTAASTTTPTAATGGIFITAGRDLTLDTLTASSRNETVRNATNFSKSSSSQDLGTSLQSQGNLVLNAGTNLTATAALIGADAAVALKADKGDLQLLAGQATSTSEAMSQVTKKGILSKKTTTTYDFSSQLQSIGTTVSGQRVEVQAGQDLTLKGSTVVSDLGTSLIAGRDVLIASTIENQTANASSQTVKSGLLGGGGFGITIGTRSVKQTQDHTGDTAAGSTVAAVSGDVSITAGRNYTQTGSSLQAPGGSITVDAQAITVQEARERASTTQTTEFRQSGVTLALKAPGLDSAMSAAGAAKQAQLTDDPRMKALAVATAASKAIEATKALEAMAEAADKGKNTGVSVSISVGSSQATSSRTMTSDVGAASSISAAGNVSLNAHGGGAASNLTVQGSEVQAGGKATLNADNDIRLLAAQDLSEQHSKNQSSSASVGVSLGIGKGSTNGIFASASIARGNADGSDATQRNASVIGQDISLTSGNDTTLQGATVSGANSVKASVGGNLSIQSLQDTAKYDSKQQSASATVAYQGASFSADVALAQTKVGADFASVAQQSGIKAGDGGFQIDVKGNTDLKGAAITSTQAAIDAGKNTLATGSLTASDLQNHNDFKAQSFSVAAGTSGGSAGAFQKSGHETSTTQSALSQSAITIANGDTSALNNIKANATNDTPETGLNKNWDGEKLGQQAQVNASIVQSFGALAAKEAGAFAKGKSDELKLAAQQALAEGNRDEANRLWDEGVKWDEGGTYRLALHGAIGGATGGLGGAVGGVASQAAVPKLGELIKETDLSLEVKQGLVLAAGSVIGAVTGGTQGAATGFDATANNFLSNPALLKKNQALAVLRERDQKNFFEELLSPTKGVLDAAKTQDALQYMDRRSDGLLQAYRENPKALSPAEINELGVYLGAYAASNGKQAAADLVKFGPTPSMANSDVPELARYAKSLLMLNGVQEAQAQVGTPALQVLSGPVGALARMVQAAQSSAQVVMGVAEIKAGDDASGWGNIGLGLLGYAGAVGGQVAVTAKPVVSAAVRVDSGAAAGGTSAGMKVGAATDATATSPYNTAGMKYGEVKMTDASGNAVPTQPSLQPVNGANGGVATKVATGELAGTADQVFPGVSKGTYNPSGPVLGQATGDSCAAGCTRMAAVPDVPEFYIRDAIGTQANQGTSLANIPSGLKELGYKGNASYTANATVDTVAQQTASGNAVIVNVKTPGGDVHAIVVDSISNGTAYIRDPLPMPGAVGSGGSAYSIPASALKNQMTGKAVYITPPSP